MPTSGLLALLHFRMGMSPHPRTEIYPPDARLPLIYILPFGFIGIRAVGSLSLQTEICKASQLLSAPSSSAISVLKSSEHGVSLRLASNRPNSSKGARKLVTGHWQRECSMLDHLSSQLHACTGNARFPQLAHQPSPSSEDVLYTSPTPTF